MEDKIKRIIQISQQIGDQLEDPQQEESEEVRAWKNESTKHQELYAEVTNSKFLKNQHQYYHSVDVENEFKRFQKRRFHRTRMIRRISTIAACMMIGLTLYYWNDKSITTTEQIAKTEIIQPGSPKAYLVINNQEKVLLTDSCSWNVQDGVLVRDSVGKGLSYTNTTKNEEATVQINKLVVPRGGEYKLTLTDGTRIWMNAESELEYPTNFSDTIRSVKLKGEAYFEVAKDKTKPFHVFAGDLDLRVYGTTFNVNTHIAGKIQTVLVEGKLGVRTLQTGREVMMEPSQLAIYDEERKETEVKQVNSRIYTAWREGWFLFEAARLENVLEQLSRWYNVDIIYMQEDVKDLQIFGSMKHYDSIEVILQAIEKNVNIHFKINGKTITVTQ